MKFSSKICIPIQAPTMRAALKAIKKAQKHADIIEIWLDQIENLKLPKLIKRQKKVPFLIVNKSKEEKGNWQGTEEDRIDLLKQAAQLGAKYIDIGIHTKPSHIKDLIKAKKKSHLIISFHDFNQTPSPKELQSIITKIKKYKPKIIKIATFAHTQSDSLQLLNLLDQLNSQKQPAIILGMGEQGKITRIAGSYLGNFCTFAPLSDKETTAPGQIKLSALQKLKNLL